MASALPATSSKGTPAEVALGAALSGRYQGGGRRGQDESSDQSNLGA